MRECVCEEDGRADCQATDAKDAKVGRKTVAPKQSRRKDRAAKVERKEIQYSRFASRETRREDRHMKDGAVRERHIQRDIHTRMPRRQERK